jgi:hypothetical protein
MGTVTINGNGQHRPRRSQGTYGSEGNMRLLPKVWTLLSRMFETHIWWTSSWNCKVRGRWIEVSIVQTCGYGCIWSLGRGSDSWDGDSINTVRGSDISNEYMTTGWRSIKRSGVPTYQRRISGWESIKQLGFWHIKGEFRDGDPSNGRGSDISKENFMVGIHQMIRVSDTSNDFRIEIYHRLSGWLLGTREM